MDLREESKATVLVSLCKGHCHRVGVERRPENPGLLQKAPNNTAPALAAHEPLDVTLLGFTRQAVAGVALLFAARLGVNVEWVVVAHVQRLELESGGMCTP